jgi:uncharacterized membrane protein YkoI
MQRKTIVAAITVPAVLALTGAIAVYAADQGDLGVTQASVDLTQAIAAAEQHVGGKASSAEFERELGKSVYEIEVIKDQTVTEVHVDAASGKVISAIVEKPDRDDDD